MFYITLSLAFVKRLNYNKIMIKKTKKIRYIFWGTSDFGAIVLEKLIEHNLVPLTVITTPDKPVGRKRILTPSPVKKIALKYKLPILEPSQIKDNSELKKQLISLSPDIFLVASYGKILPTDILKIPVYGSLNIHPSLLPKYRGASPIQTAILNGDENNTGVSIILMDEKIDHGKIIIKIKNQKHKSKINYKKLSDELANLGAEAFIKILPDWVKGKIKSLPQADKNATFTKIIKKEDGEINWQNSADFIERMVRAYSLWPVAYSQWQGKTIKIIEAEIAKENDSFMPGTVFLNKKKDLCVACGKGALILKKIQLEGGKILSAKDFLNGHRQILGQIL